MWTDLRALSFDLDDTLWEVDPVLVRAERALSAWLAERHPRMAELHTPDASRTLRQSVAARHPERAHDLTWVRTESLRHLAREGGYPPEVADEAFGVFHAARCEVDPYPDVAPALEALARRYPLYALSNGNADIRRTPLAAHFTLGVSASDAGAAKPDRRIFDHLLALAALEPGHVLHVGDDPVTDVHGAREAGCRTIWVNRRDAEWPEHLDPPDAVVSDLDELVRLLG